MNFSIKKSMKKRTALIAGVAVVTVLAMPVSTFAFSNNGMFAQYRKDWVKQYCTKWNGSSMFSTICTLIESDEDQQQEINQLTTRVDALESGEVVPNTNLQLQIAGVKLGEAVSVGSPIKFFSKPTDRIVEISTLGDTASGADLSYHFGIVESLYYTSADCSGTPYVSFNNEDEEQRLLNNVILNGVNQHYVADRSTPSKSLAPKSARHMDQRNRTTECRGDVAGSSVKVLTASQVTMPISEPLAKPFLFVYE